MSLTPHSDARPDARILLAPAAFAATVAIALAIFLAPCDLKRYAVPLLQRYVENFGYVSSDVCFLIKRALLTLVLVPLIFIGHRRFVQLSASRQRVFLGLISATATLSTALIVREIYSSYVDPHTWDFLAFYMDGRVSSMGLDFYRPESYDQALAATQIPFQPADSFLSGVGGSNKTAFKYPPPTMLLFWPLGYFSYQTAHHLWTALNGIVILIDVLLLTRLFFANIGWRGIATAASLLLLFPAARKTAYFEQTTFILLAFTLLLWKDRLLPRAGLWCALAACIKPFMALIALYPLLRRKWMMLAWIAAAGVVISVATAVAIGPAHFVSFFTARTLARVPSGAYLEWINQSWLATVLRATHYEFVHPAQFKHPVFLAGALILVLSTAWALYRPKQDQPQVMLSLVMLLGLMLYPGMLAHYSLIALVPMLFLYRSSNNAALPKQWHALLPWAFGALYVLFDVAAFYGNLILWGVFLALCAKGTERETVQEHAALALG